jgi:DNA primase
VPQLAIVEGLEDGLSLAQAGAAEMVLALPGIGRFSKFDLPAGAEVVVFRDGDAADSAAAKQLCEACDRWLLAGARVRVTDTPAGEDANSLMQERGKRNCGDWSPRRRLLRFPSMPT